VPSATPLPSLSTVTQTPTPGTGGDGTLVIEEGQVMPVPILPQGHAPRVLWRLSGPAERLQWRLYSRAWVACAVRTQDGSFEAGWNQAPLDLPADLASGTYYLELKAVRGGVISKPRVLKLVVLR
jgi:hypothetical protein